MDPAATEPPSRPSYSGKGLEKSLRLRTALLAAHTSPTEAAARLNHPPASPASPEAPEWEAFGALRQDYDVAGFTSEVPVLVIRRSPATGPASGFGWWE